MRYLIIRTGSNAANQSYTMRLVLGAVEIEGNSTTTRQRQLLDRFGSNAPGTLQATTTFRRDDGQCWHAYRNQAFYWKAWNRASAADKAACLRQDAAQVDPWAGV